MSPTHSKMKILDEKVLQMVCRLADMSHLHINDAIDLVCTKIDEQVQFWENHYDMNEATTQPGDDFDGEDLPTPLPQAPDGIIIHLPQPMMY